MNKKKNHPSGSSEKLNGCLGKSIPPSPLSLLLSICIFTILSFSLQKDCQYFLQQKIKGFVIFLLKSRALDSHRSVLQLTDIQGGEVIAADGICL